MRERDVPNDDDELFHEGPGADTHVVGFEGSRDHVVAVGKKMNFMRAVLGASDERVARVLSLYQKYKLSEVFTALGLIR